MFEMCQIQLKSITCVVYALLVNSYPSFALFKHYYVESILDNLKH